MTKSKNNQEKMSRGRPKGEHKTMISARLTDEALKYLNKAHNYYGINKSAYISRAIIELYKAMSTILIQTTIKEEETN